MLPVSLIVSACKAQWSGPEEERTVKYLITDTRKISPDLLTAQALFIAIVTQRSNGHLYIGDAYTKGIRCFLVSERTDAGQYPDAVFLLVNNTVAALQQIAVYVRAQFHIPVIGITGSNGKTIIKEWLYQLLEKQEHIIRSPKSYNSQIGVPLSVWPMEATHTLGIFEAGISQPGEMEQLEKIIRPTIGIFTNIGEAHNQGFLNSRQKINEKLRLFRQSELLIYCRDYHELHEAVALFAQSLKTNTAHQLQLLSWSYKHEAALAIQSLRKEGGRTQITALYKGQEQGITIPFTDAASIENAINCWCLLLYRGLAAQEIQEGMATLKPIAMRLELRQGENNSVIINDAYNSDLTSLGIALDMLEQQKQQSATTVILSDMQQTGRAESVLYTEVADILKERKIKRLIAIGTALVAHRKLFEGNVQLQTAFFATTEDFLHHIHEFSFDNEAILLKGARSFAFEKISLLLEQKIHQTVMTVNLTAMNNNLDAFRRRLKSGVRTMAMVKASSYGSGGYEIANALQEQKVDYLTVAYADEGVALRKARIELPIMVMSPSTQSFDRMIIWKLEPEVFNLRSLHQFIEVARNIGVQQYPVHIKLDTGMHRLGFMQHEIEALLQLIKNEPVLHVASIFSHLAAADDAAYRDFTRTQAEAFVRMSTQISDALGYQPLRHLCNTAGIVQYPEYHFDMVRLGLGLYGIDSSGGLDDQLQQISTLRTTIAQIKHIPAGETIGYGRRGKADRDMRIATICIGYADGYPRALSNSGAYVMINNKPAPVIGTIAMDMCMVDITDIDAVHEGDEIIVFGDALPIQKLASWAGTISYEIMTGIAQRVKRVYVNES
ncbi:MAG TPA: bifunctional UDP-N-acetylmuramoyl-tripeptide:D-alanyl-D-alanine ligase/alanine racemase [Chitinophagaceae bacterium]|nr:bifunctional UDP-N-acetylmuramoyl-tripeptide:D-alanyl-D-alanine ligase/alanine racemase [Chitinophagaceae bacterium]